MVDPQQQQRQRRRRIRRGHRGGGFTLALLVAAAAAPSCAFFVHQPLSASRRLHQHQPQPQLRPAHPTNGHQLQAKAGGASPDKEKQRKEKEKLAALMAKQEREAVKKYLETQAKKEAAAAERTRQSQEEMAARATKGKDAPWSKTKDGKGDVPPPSQPPKKKKPGFQQITLTCRTFSVDDIQDVTFEGSHLKDVPFLGLPEIAVFGRSNVGKSSLLNCLTGMNKKVAVVSKTPGRTQQINLFKVTDDEVERRRGGIDGFAYRHTHSLTYHTGA